MEVRLGRNDSDFVCIEVRQRSHPQATDYWDANYLAARFSVGAGPWRGALDGDVRVDELQRLRASCETLHEQLDGRAELDPMEPYLTLAIEGDGRGHFRVAGRAGVPGSANGLDFELPELELWDLAEFIDQLRAVGDAFPLVGDPPQPISRREARRFMRRARRGRIRLD